MTQPGAVLRAGRALEECVQWERRCAAQQAVGKGEIFLDIDVVQTIIILSCFYSPARVLSSISAKGSDDRQTEWSEQGQREREANSLDVAPGIDRRNKF